MEAPRKATTKDNIFAETTQGQARSSGLACRGVLQKKKYRASHWDVARSSVGGLPTSGDLGRGLWPTFQLLLAFLNAKHLRWGFRVRTPSPGLTTALRRPLNQWRSQGEQIPRLGEVLPPCCPPPMGTDNFSFHSLFYGIIFVSGIETFV